MKHHKQKASKHQHRSSSLCICYLLRKVTSNLTAASAGNTALSQLHFQYHCDHKSENPYLSSEAVNRAADSKPAWLLFFTAAITTNNNNNIKVIIFSFLCKRHCFCLIKKNKNGSFLVWWVLVRLFQRNHRHSYKTSQCAFIFSSKNNGRENLMVQWSSHFALNLLLLKGNEHEQSRVSPSLNLPV